MTPTGNQALEMQILTAEDMHANSANARADKAHVLRDMPVILFSSPPAHPCNFRWIWTGASSGAFVYQVNPKDELEQEKGAACTPISSQGDLGSTYAALQATASGVRGLRTLRCALSELLDLSLGATDVLSVNIGNNIVIF